MPLKINNTPIEGLLIVDTDFVSDKRGAFSRLFCTKELSQLMLGRALVQINQSQTNELGAVRGLHFQHSPYAEMKLVRCLKGRVFDVAVDLRAGSPTFLKWYAQELSPDNRKMMIIPEGCAHGFQVLELETQLLYLHTNFYEPTAEGGIRYDDPIIRIDWPLPITELSVRDRNHPLLTQEFEGIEL